MKHIIVILSFMLLVPMAFSQLRFEEKTNKWNLSLTYDLNHLNYSFKTYHFGVDKHWGIVSFNAVDLSLSYNIFRSINIGTGVSVNLHSIAYDRVYVNLYFRNYEKIRKYSLYPEFRFGLIRARTAHPGTVSPTLFAGIHFMTEVPVRDDLILSFGPGFTYFTDEFNYGYWEVRYAPIVGNTVYVDDPVMAKNYLVNFRIGVKYNF